MKPAPAHYELRKATGLFDYDTLTPVTPFTDTEAPVVMLRDDMTGASVGVAPGVYYLTAHTPFGFSVAKGTKPTTYTVSTTFDAARFHNCYYQDFYGRLHVADDGTVSMDEEWA